MFVMQYPAGIYAVAEAHLTPLNQLAAVRRAANAGGKARLSEPAIGDNAWPEEELTSLRSTTSKSHRVVTMARRQDNGVNNKNLQSVLVRLEGWTFMLVVV